MTSLNILKCLCFFSLAACATSAPAQTCLHTGLSKTFDFQTKLKRIKKPDDSCDSCVITVVVTRKIGKNPSQAIHFPGYCLFSTAYQHCNATRSFATGKNLAAAAPDNDYGDFVVADFNFDGRDDFAAKCDSGGNGGPVYNFYIQRNDGFFALDEFLTSRMMYFPATFNKKSQSLTTLVHTGVSWMGETTFKLNPKTNNWQLVKHKQVTAEAN